VDQIDAGSISADKLTQQARTFITDIVFSSSADDQVDWTSGTIEMANGDTYSITASNTGTLGAGLTYIYFDPTVSTTALQVTQSISTAIGDDIILMCVAKPSSVSTSYAFFVPGVGVFGLTADQLSPDIITETEITDNSISAPKIQSNAVIAAKIQSGAVIAGKIAAGAVDTDELNANAVTGAKIKGLTIEGIHIAGNTIAAEKLTSLTGGGLTINFAATGANPVLSHSKFSLNADGSASFSGGLTAASGTFAGDLQAVGGDFNGELKASSIAVKTAGGTLRGYISTVTSGSLALQDASANDRVRVFGGGVYMATGSGGLLTIADDGGTTQLDCHLYRSKFNKNAVIGGSAYAVGFFGNNGVTKQTLNGVKSGGTALANLITLLANHNFLTDNTT
jgi:hypothetical protein